MNNFKKIGLTALAASLVSVSAHAGAISVSGGASMGPAGYSGEEIVSGNEYSMGNQLTFSGSGELDNGLTVSVSFVLDQGDNELVDDESGNAPFDSHSVSISSDSLGTLTLHGEGGSTTTSMIDGSAAGDIWDKFDTLTNAAGLTNVDGVTATATPGGNSFYYSSPELMEGLTFQAHFEPQTATEVSGTGYGVTYTGVEGLTLKYANADATNATSALSGDNTVMSASYAYGPVTVSYSDMEHDLNEAAHDFEMTSYAVSYTVSDELSVTYGQEELTREGVATSAEYSGISAAYTTGGMTISAGMWDATDAAFDTGSHSDVEKWTLGVSFAF
jgi:outer membrane protein OmpU